jgi:hypothetical protein
MMSFRRNELLVSLVAVLLGSAVSGASAAPVAYEGFSYEPGIALNGSNGGEGFSGGWFVDTYSYVVASGSLANPGGTLLSSGNSLRHTGLQPRARRNLTSMFLNP